MSIIGFLLALLVLVVVIFAVKLVLDYCEVTGPIRQLVLLIVALLCILMILNQLGVVGAPVRAW